MKKALIILILLTLKLTVSFSQDIKFKWSIWPSFGNAHEVTVEKKDSKCYLHIKKISGKKSLKKRIPIEAVDSLINFLENYDFPHRGSSIRDTLRTYFETKILPDTNWVYVNGDSLRLNQLTLHKMQPPYYNKIYDGYYEYDRKLKKCYIGYIKCDIWTDGTSYKGEYIKLNSTRTFSVYCSRVSPNDYILNKLVVNLVNKYDKKGDFTSLKKQIEKDIPVSDNNINQKKLLQNDKNTIEN